MDSNNKEYLFKLGEIVTIGLSGETGQIIEKTIGVSIDGSKRVSYNVRLKNSYSVFSFLEQELKQGKPNDK